MGTGRKFIPVKDNLLYSKFIYCIAGGNDYNKLISELLDKEDSNTQRQLTKLEKLGWISSKKIINKKVFPMEQKRIYSVNWEKIIESFLETIKERKELTMNLERVVDDKTGKEFKEFRTPNLNKIREKKFMDKLKKNEYLILFFKIYFNSIWNLLEKKNDITMIGYFEILMYSGFDYTGKEKNLLKWLEKFDVKKQEKITNLMKESKNNQSRDYRDYEIFCEGLNELRFGNISNKMSLSKAHTYIMKKYLLEKGITEKEIEGFK